MPIVNQAIWDFTTGCLNKNHQGNPRKPDSQLEVPLKNTQLGPKSPQIKTTKSHKTLPAEPRLQQISLHQELQAQRWTLRALRHRRSGGLSVRSATAATGAATGDAADAADAATSSERRRDGAASLALDLWGLAPVSTNPQVPHGATKVGHHGHLVVSQHTQTSMVGRCWKYVISLSHVHLFHFVCGI